MCRYTVSAILMARTNSNDVYLTASMTWRCGCDPADYSCTSRRLKRSGARWWPSSIRFNLFNHSWLDYRDAVRAVRDLCIYIDCGLTIQRTSLKLYRAVSRFFDEFAGNQTSSPVARRFHGFDASGLWKCDSCPSAQRVARLTSVSTTRRHATNLLRLIYSKLLPWNQSWKITRHYSRTCAVAFCDVHKCELSCMSPGYNIKLRPHRVKLYQ